MARRKVKLVFISNDSARKLCLKKRRVGLLKKVSELTVLCGVDAFCIIYCRDDSEPMIWPSSPAIQVLLADYLNLPNIERCKKSVNQEIYLKERIGKAKDQSVKNLKKIKEIDLCRYMQQLQQSKCLDHLTVDELVAFGWLIQEKIINFTKRTEYFDQVPPLYSESFLAYCVGENHKMVNLHDALQWSQSPTENLMNNNDLGVGRSIIHDDTSVPLGFNMNSAVANMVIENPLYGEIDPRKTITSSYMGFPNLVTNFNGGGDTKNVTSGYDTIGLELPHESLTNGVDYGDGFGFVRPTHSNLLRFGNNIENVNAMSLRVPYGSWRIGGNHQVQPYNGIQSGIMGRNCDYQIVMSNDYINPEFENEMGVGSHINNFATNIDGNDLDNSAIGLGVPNNHIGSSINSGGGNIERNVDSQDTLFGGTTDVQRLNITTTTNNNNLAP